jgi:hypothetical protein
MVEVIVSKILSGIFWRLFAHIGTRVRQREDEQNPKNRLGKRPVVQAAGCTSNRLAKLSGEQ